MQVLVALLVVLFLSLSLSAAEQPRPLSDYTLKRWDSSDGLPHNSINELVQTGDGYLWLATWEGLARYNGVEFEIFGRGDVTGLPSSAIRTVSGDTNGGMLVTTVKGGLSYYKRGKWQALAPAAGLVRSILRTRNGDLWLGTEGRGLYRRPAGQLETSDADQLVLPDVLGHKLIEDKLGQLWLAADQGLFLLDNDVFERMGTEHGLPSGIVYDLLLRPDGQLLVATTQGVWKREKGHFSPLHPALMDVSVSRMLIDHQGDLWVGTINSGLYRLSEHGLEHLGDAQGMPQNRVMGLLQDRELNLWVGTNAGLIRLSNALFSNWTERRGLNGNYVRTVLSHSDGSLWVGSSRGLSRIVDGKATAVVLPEAYSTLSVLSLAEGVDGSIWVGTYSQGLFNWKQGRLTPVEITVGGLNSNEVRALAVDNQGAVWVGTPQGVVLRQPDGRLRRLGIADGLPDEFIWVLAQDTQGRVWAGSNRAASWFENGQFHRLTLSGLEEVERIFGLTFVREELWLSTELGLVRYRFADQTAELITRDEGLASDTVFQAVPDRLGGLWLTSSRGVMKVRMADIDDYLAGQLSALPVDIYDESDGLATVQANGASSPSATIDQRGQIWVATAMGVGRAQPERKLRSGDTYFPVQIEKLQVDGKPRSLAAVVNLAPGTGRLSVQYAGLNYRDPGHIRYRTLLEGFDAHWVERGHQRNAEYTNLPPGRYRLRIQAGYPPLLWGLNETSVEVIQRPFYWQQTWFKSLLVLLVAVLVALVSKWRVYRLQRIEVELSRRVSQQTQALRQQAAELERQAREDPLTGLPNRRAFDERLATGFGTAVQQRTLLALAVIDIDHFKRINDRWSHLVGDEAICAVAGLLQDQLRSGWQVARWGGEEFTLVFPTASPGDAFHQCDQLRQLIAEQSLIASVSGLKLTVSIGLAFSDQASSYARMLSQADIALYQAKRSGRNRVETWSEEIESVALEGDQELMMLASDSS